MRTTRSIRSIALIAGPVIAFVVAWTTGSIGDDPGEVIALANVALVLAAITVAAALVSWQAGAATSIVAALALNWFHTQPYGTLRITSGDDVASVMLLAALGAAVSGVSAWRDRSAVRAGRAAASSEARAELALAMQTPRPAIEVWHAALAAVPAELALVDARVVERAPDGLARVARQRWTEEGEHTFVLSPAGAWIDLGTDTGAVLVIRPRSGQSTLVIDRRVLTTFADSLHLGLANA